MNLYDKSSLILVPSGVKASKVYSQRPENGSGDFTFSRSTSATRVGPSGYIEKETQNLLLQSNSFDTTWVDSGTISKTSGQSGYDGSSDAWLLTKSSASAYIYQNVSSGLNTISIYAKSGSLNWLYILKGGNTGQYYNLSTGVLGSSNGPSPIDASIEDVGGGWYRCSLTYTDAFSGSLRFYPADANLDVSGTSGNIYIQDAQLEQGLVARDYIETTTSAVYGGITDNIPRLDYNGSCPSLLLEPQRTNSLPYSEDFSNAAWAKSNVSVTINSTTSPDGLANGSLMTITGGTSDQRISDDVTYSGTNVFSVFAKANDSKWLSLRIGSSANKWFDLENGVLGGSTITTALVDSFIEDFGNGWYRCGIIFTDSSTTNTRIYPAENDLDITHTSGSVYIWGAQAESSSSYATSYIPTYGSAVTRNVDSCSKTGVSSLIGQTEGTLFAEVSVDTDSVSSLLNRVISVTDGTLSNRVLIVLNTDETFRFIIIGGGSTLANITTSASALNGFHKVALGYKANDYVAYVDGVQVGSNTTAASVPSSLSQAFLGSVEAGATSSVLEGSVKQSLMFKTRLSNEELAALTTI